MSSSIRTCLWFRDGRGREAAEFYCSLIPDSRVERIFAGDAGHGAFSVIDFRSEEHTSELQSLMRISYAVFCLKNKTLNIYHRSHSIKSHKRLHHSTD